MSHIGTSPPSGVNESCMELTDPFDAAVVAVAQSAELAMPKRVSLPSMLPPGCIAEAAWSTPSASKRGFPACSAANAPTSRGTKITSMAASTAQPCRLSLTMLPNV